MTSDTGSSDTPSTSTKAPAARPKEIKLDGIDPCKALTAAQQTELKIDESESDPSEVVKGTTSPSCAYTSNAEKSYVYRVTLISNEGIDHWDGPSNLDVAPKQVSGYAAAQVMLKGTSTLECSVAVDVADEQQLFVQFLPYSRVFTQDEMCQNAAKGAESALKTLQTLK
ncbi:hypothetical protein FHS29_001095 [Saccharothrix tamanrassetensis]|uniref:DUF3558 domain-containing protein n=1 Tax=Saccharothrix tamanrassetensis TaxID=1051531 RepID=A0A841CET3_9PSEU|nr:hypothetical protein [Saccharothrix tamanrassetensis]